MILYSQKDPSFEKLKIGNVSFPRYGCLVCSIATLYQSHPITLLESKKGIISNGDADTKVLAVLCGGEALPKVKTPISGWCIAMTKHYAVSGYPTHFYCYNHDTQEMIDPLDYPAVRKPNKYKIAEYRPFTSIRLDFAREDLEKRLNLAESALKSDRISGVRKTSLVRFAERVTSFLSRL